MDQKKWDDRYMKIAWEVANWSKDVDTGVGSVLVSKYNSLISIGFNGPPRSVEDSTNRLKKPDKYDYMIHSEVNNLHNAALNGASVVGGTLYCTLFPCNHCSMNIIQSQIARLVAPLPNYERSQSKYDISLQLFKEANVQIDYHV